MLSGDDPLTLPDDGRGGSGVISVASNVIPAEWCASVPWPGRWDEARELHRKYVPAVPGMFLDTNPIPVKAAMAMMGLDRGGVSAAPVPPVGRAEPAQFPRDLASLGLL